MAREHDGNAGLVLMAFVMGAVTGAAVALLYAPTSGEETRRLLNERAREGRDRALDAAQRPPCRPRRGEAPQESAADGLRTGDESEVMDR